MTGMTPSKELERYFADELASHATGRLFGRPVITSELLTISVPLEIRRTWRERLFSRPWQPLRKTRTRYDQNPDPSIYELLGVLHMHPKTFDRLNRSLQGTAPSE